MDQRQLLPTVLVLICSSIGCSWITAPGSLRNREATIAADHAPQLGTRRYDLLAPGGIHLRRLSTSSPKRPMEPLDSPSADRSSSFQRLVDEAKEALGAVLTGELVYYQRYVTFTDAADTSDLRLELGVVLEEPSQHWLFEVSDESATGFTASARGREDTKAEGILVMVRYERGKHPVWRIRRRAG